MYCDDETLKMDSTVYKWSNLLLEGFAGNGRPLNTALNYKEQLTAAGFVDVVEVKYKWPSNRWPKNEKHKLLGQSMQ